MKKGTKIKKIVFKPRRISNSEEISLEGAILNAFDMANSATNHLSLAGHVDGQPSKTGNKRIAKAIFEMLLSFEYLAKAGEITGVLENGKKFKLFPKKAS